MLRPSTIPVPDREELVAVDLCEIPVEVDGFSVVVPTPGTLLRDMGIMRVVGFATADAEGTWFFPDEIT